MTLDLRRPATLAEAISDLSKDGALALGGGMSVVLLMNTGLLDPARLVSLAAIPGLDGVREVDGMLEIGAMCTHAQLSQTSLLVSRLPMVASMFGHIGNVRVRAWATVGGNLAHADPAQDPPVLLSALGATVLTAGQSGSREIPVRALSDGPFSTILAGNELITTVRVPLPSSGVRCAYRKFLPRTADDYATVSAAARLDVDADGLVAEADLVLGSVGPTPVVASEAAQALVGHSPGDPEVLAEMASLVRDTVSPADDIRASSEYRREMAGVMARRAVMACASP